MENPAFINKDDQYYNLEKTRIAALIRPGPNTIMDLGCATGRLGRRLRENHKANYLVGVEIFPEAAKEASKVYDAMHSGDIEFLDLDYKEFFDYVICGDILEHLRDPWKTIERIRRWLKKEGVLICSLPNVRYWSVLRDLIFFGDWHYEDAGILDKTHLRFFTKRTLLKALKDAQFDIIECRMIIHGPKKNIMNRLTLGLGEEFLGSQILVVAQAN
jgi:O-antigen biosynthesis protein